MSEMLRSSTNPMIKKIAALGKRKYREESGLFLVEGIRAAEEAFDSGWLLQNIVYSPQLLSTSRGMQLLEKLQLFCRTQDVDCRVVPVDETVFAKLAATESPQGVLLVLRKKTMELVELVSPKSRSFLLVLDGVQDPGNAGTIIRAADAAGCTGIIALKGCVDLFAPKTVRASMGSLLHLPVLENVDPDELLTACRQAGIKLLATTPEAAAVDHYDIDYCQSFALILGNEGNGITPYLLSVADEKVRIPILGKAESLNVAMAAGIILYEAVRQRR